jgi:hypothetical protein
MFFRHGTVGGYSLSTGFAPRAAKSQECAGWVRRKSRPDREYFTCSLKQRRTVLKADVVASIEHALADRPRDWRVSIIGSQANDQCEMKIAGPNAFERSYTLEGSSGEHRPEMIRVLLGKLVPR